ncbi:heterokaryon incompatibility protein-domain-containing protein [Aspergillus multicolor]|uniref:heterokaryon incompatibility protein-domain-containing protein n=1 Tax=Aspergillus multicolor TaxID=41759 RepID=UPI003CCC9B9D
MASNTQPTYTYSALPTSSSIRLLGLPAFDPSEHVKTSTGEPLIRLTLETVDLDTNPKFTALPWHILVNGSHVSVSKSLYEFLRQLYPLSEDVNQPPSQGNRKTGLMAAVKEGVPIEVKNYLYGGADVNAADDQGRSALHYATARGDPRLVRLLVEVGADPSKVDEHRKTAVDYAEEEKVERVMDALRTPSRPKLIERKPPPWSLPNRHIWIDAVCINQGDIAKRNAQVAMMSRIYSQAACVLVWLGPHDSLTRLVHEQVWRICTCSDKAAFTDEDRAAFDKWFEQIHKQEPILPKREDRPDEDLDTVDVKANAIQNFFNRAWFQRVWVNPGVNVE